MDKRTVYGRFDKRYIRGKSVPTFECGLTERNELCMANPCKGCVERVLVNPAALAEVEEDARVGRAVEEWLDAQGWVDRVVFADTGGLHVMLNELREVIAKAREATPHA